MDIVYEFGTHKRVKKYHHMIDEYITLTANRALRLKTGSMSLKNLCGPDIVNNEDMYIMLYYGIILTKSHLDYIILCNIDT